MNELICRKSDIDERLVFIGVVGNVAANRGGVPERNPLISNPYGWEGYNSLQNMRMRIENLDENLKYGKPGNERRKTGQPPKLIKAIVSPIVALPNAVVTVFNGEDMYGNEVSSAQRWIGAPISATLFLFPTQITSYLDIPEVSVYIIDPLINKSLE